MFRGYFKNKYVKKSFFILKNEQCSYICFAVKMVQHKYTNYIYSFIFILYLNALFIVFYDLFQEFDN